MAETNTRVFSTFNVNNIFTPRIGGHQPLYRDRWAQLYDRYRVMACRFHIWFRPNRVLTYSEVPEAAPAEVYVADSDAYNMSTIPSIIGWEVNNEGTPLHFQIGDQNALREGRITKPRMHDYTVTGAGPYKTYHFKHTVSMRDVYNDAGRLQDTHAVDGNPNVAAYLYIVLMSKNGVDTSRFEIDVKLEYLVEFSGPNGLNPENEN